MQTRKIYVQKKNSKMTEKLPIVILELESILDLDDSLT